jgi:LCP family protein required for cell wall assembly
VGQINGSLAYGPGCTVAAVHQLTGIAIDHFVMVDFTGVIKMSDSVGGVSVCVTNNVYDTYSHLKLSKGTHTLKGLAALEFVRSRHGFADGSDLGRTYAQHAFLSAVIRSIKRKGVLLNPKSVLSLAQAATKALTVDKGLGSIPKLLNLATDLNKVPTDRITFTTMQNVPDPTNTARVLLGPGAKTLFATIINDQSLTSAAGKKTSTATATATPTPAVTTAPSTVVAQISNASGLSGRALDVETALEAKGFRSAKLSVATATAISTATKIHYGPGQQTAADTLAKAIKLPTSSVSASTTITGVTLDIGTDWAKGTTYPSRSSTTKAALDQSHAQNALDNKCVPVSTQNTVPLNRVWMTPGQAFAESPNVKVSAP